MAKRNWTTYNYAALWISMAHCIPTYMLASGLIAAGMNWRQALFTILLGNTIVLVPILLNSHPGTKYGIPFPVFARASYGVIGSNLPALMRALVACGWFGIQAWIGGEALHTLFKAIIPGWQTLAGGPVGGHSDRMAVVSALLGDEHLHHLSRNGSAARGRELGRALRAGDDGDPVGLGDLARPRIGQSVARRWQVSNPGRILAGLHSVVDGDDRVLGDAVVEYARLHSFGRSQREQSVGQVAALPATMTVFAAMGVMITSAAIVIYPQMKPNELWDPLKVVSQFDSLLVVAISMFTAVVATLAVNIAANVVSPANDFANAFPRLISFRTGGLITGVIGILMQPGSCWPIHRLTSSHG